MMSLYMDSVCIAIHRYSDRHTHVSLYMYLHIHTPIKACICSYVHAYVRHIRESSEQEEEEEKEVKDAIH